MDLKGNVYLPSNMNINQNLIKGMSNSLKRAILRQEKNIDIEVTVVINVVQ